MDTAPSRNATRFWASAVPPIALRLLHLEVQTLDDWPPLVAFLLQKCRQLVRRVANEIGALLLEAFDHGGPSQHLHRLGMQPGEDIVGRFRRSGKRVPGRREDALHAGL